MKSDTMDICTLLVVLAFLAILAAMPIVGIVMHLNGDSVGANDSVDAKVVVSSGTCDNTDGAR